MTDKPLITTIDEAKAALDEEIASAQDMVNLYQRELDGTKAKQQRYEETLWRLKSIRRRMDPIEQPILMAVHGVAVAQDAA
jgi:hypothetical protein